jgi:GTPase Era involved in 16S rRNA processing
MKAIIIEEERFAEIAELMRHKATELHKNGYLYQQAGLTEQQMKFAADEIHRSIHYYFVRWAQSHGVSCVSK